MTSKSDEKFFPVSVVSNLTDKKKVSSEKIKLEFSLLHADPGIYSIEVKLYDNQPLDFISEARQIFSEGQIDFEKFFVCDFYFGKQQIIEIIYHKNKSGLKFTIPLGYILGSLNSMLSILLEGKTILVVNGVRLPNNEDLLNVKISLVEDGHNSNYFVNRKIYFSIACGNKNIYRSAEIMDNGVFIPTQIPICVLQPSYTINFYNSNNEKKFFYKVFTNNIKAREFKNTVLDNKYFTLKDFSEIIKKYTFFDYLEAGIQIALSIGIDFSNKNKEYNLNNHNINENGFNEFENAIYLCSNILGYYDYDQKYPAYGFGAWFDDDVTRIGFPSFFNLNLASYPEIEKIENVLKAYRNLIKGHNFLISSKVFFAPLIRKIMKNITQKNNVFEYNILLILSTGVIDDLQETIDVLVEACLLPLSIVIVGIGDGDFKNMETLDGDIFPLTSSKGKKRIRDIVQFVPFSNYKNDMEKLSMEVLAEIPRQVLEFYTIKNLKPEDIRNLTKNAKVIRRTKTNPFQGNNNNININNPYQEYRIGFDDNFGKGFMNLPPAGYNPQIKSYEPNYHASLSDGNIIRFPKAKNINKDPNNAQKEPSVIYNNIYGNGNNNI